MGTATVIAPRAGEVIGDTRDRRVEILSDRPALAATWSRFGAGRDGADLHVHHRHTDLFYVLQGELTLRLGPEGDGVVVPEGRLARVPPGVVHGFRNGHDAEMRFLNLHAPGEGFADYMRAMRDQRSVDFDQHAPPPDGGRTPADAVVGAADPLPGGVTLLADVEEIAIAEVSAGPGSPPAPAHVHRAHLESVYVLEGELALLASGREALAPAGTWLQVPAGVPHTLAFPGPGRARWLELHAPGRGFGAFLRAVQGDGDDARAAAARTGFDEAPAGAASRRASP